MSVQMVRFSTDAQRAHEVEEAIATLFTAVAEAAPAGMTYTAGRVGDGSDFVFMLQLAEGSTIRWWISRVHWTFAPESRDGRARPLPRSLSRCLEGTRADVDSGDGAADHDCSMYSRQRI